MEFSRNFFLFISIFDIAYKEYAKQKVSRKNFSHRPPHRVQPVKRSRTTISDADDDATADSPSRWVKPDPGGRSNGGTTAYTDFGGTAASGAHKSDGHVSISTDPDTRSANAGTVDAAGSVRTDADATSGLR